MEKKIEELLGILDQDEDLSDYGEPDNMYELTYEDLLEIIKKDQDN
ncbi:hypothetical protein [Eggerthia catenaformis]|nr:hypothetical protein [Eggerthia catenaformis]